MARKRRGRPPTPLDSKKKPEPVIAARIPDALLKKLDGMAKKRGQVPSAQTRSAEIKRALQFWVEHHAITNRHNSLLGTAVAVLADRIEQDVTHRKWLNDAATRELVRDRAVKLVSHILTPLSKRVAIPAKVKEDADLILSLLVGAMPRPGSPTLLGMVIIADRGLASILQDLAKDLGDGSVNVRAAPDELVARRQQKGK